MKKALKIIGVLLGVFIILMVIAVNTQRTHRAVAFDVPKLLNKDIQEIKSLLPGCSASESMGDWSFKKGDYEMLVTCDENTKQPVDFFVTYNGGQLSEEDLRDIANVPEDKPEYSVKVIHPFSKPEEINGITISFVSEALRK